MKSTRLTVILWVNQQDCTWLKRYHPQDQSLSFKIKFGHTTKEKKRISRRREKTATLSMTLLLTRWSDQRRGVRFLLSTKALPWTLITVLLAAAVSQSISNYSNQFWSKTKCKIFLKIERALKILGLRTQSPSTLTHYRLAVIVLLKQFFSKIRVKDKN